MKIYRFKTKEELMKEFGSNFRTKARFNSEGEMDYLFGTPVTKDFYEEVANQGIAMIDNVNPHAYPTLWSVNNKMLTWNYKPKRGEIVVITHYHSGNIEGTVTKILEAKWYSDLILCEAFTGDPIRNLRHLNKPAWFEAEYRPATEEEKEFYRLAKKKGRVAIVGQSSGKPHIC